MSLRHASRVAYQAGSRVMQGMKDHASKSYDSTIRSFKDPSRQTRKFSTAIDSNPAFRTAKPDDKLKHAEESLRTVMYLSCWGPNS